MTSRQSFGASPARDMKIDVTEQSLAAGAILEMADVFEAQDLKRVCEYALSLVGKSGEADLPEASDGLLKILADAVENLRERNPKRLPELEHFVDGVAAESYRKSRARSRKNSRGSASA
jgi:hypothetical protein